MTGGHIWAQRYDRDLDDIFAVQDEVTESIVSALAPRLAPAAGQPPARRDTQNLEAYEHFLRGRELCYQDTPQANANARELLEKAIELDPGFSQACSHLARTHVIAYANRWSDSPERSLEQAGRRTRATRYRVGREQPACPLRGRGRTILVRAAREDAGRGQAVHRHRSQLR